MTVYRIKIYEGLLNPNSKGYITTNLKGVALSTSKDLCNWAVIHTVHIDGIEIPVQKFHEDNKPKKSAKKGLARKL